MNFSIIAALTSNNVIGKLNAIPWCLPHDMVWFKYHTVNKVVVMGRKTFQSIFSRPLPNRLNIVLSRRNIIQKHNVSNLIFVRTFEEVVWQLKKIYYFGSEIMIIGGGEIYNIFFSQVNCLYLTHIDINIRGDAFFPDYNKHEWKVVFYERNNWSGIMYSFRILKRF